MLMPVLQKVIDDYQGTVVLAKVNTDAEQELAARYQIRSLPTVVLFKDGQIIDHFMGVQPEGAIQRMLDPHIVRESDLELERAANELNAGNLEAATETLKALANKEPANDRVKLKLAEVHLENEDFDAANQILSTISTDAKRENPYKSLIARVEFGLSDTGICSASELAERVRQDPNDVGSRYSLGVRYTIENNFEAAMEQFLEVVKRDRSYKDDAGRKGLLRVFDILGGEQATVSHYRTLLARALN